MATVDKIALVTGGGTGIGRAAALALQGAGYHVVICGRREQELIDTADQAQAGGGQMVAIPLDVTDEAKVEQLFQHIELRFGRLDVLFNNAGIAAAALPIDELSVEVWKAVVDVNLTATFMCARQAMRLMKVQRPKGGRIINNGSISATSPRPFSAPYTATKHAITGLTKSISLDGRADDIACSQIDIGNAETDLTRPMARGVLQANGVRTAEPRIDVKHAADAILYMAQLPLDANVQFMTLMATKMPFVGRG
jgi:NAD(P)-dependent dehydrogenase (short-subunit alcohol dehydrogenase family)